MSVPAGAGSDGGGGGGGGGLGRLADLLSEGRASLSDILSAFDDGDNGSGAAGLAGKSQMEHTEEDDDDDDEEEEEEEEGEEEEKEEEKLKEKEKEKEKEEKSAAVGKGADAGASADAGAGVAAASAAADATEEAEEEEDEDEEEDDEEEAEAGAASVAARTQPKPPSAAEIDIAIRRTRSDKILEPSGRVRVPRQRLGRVCCVLRLARCTARHLRGVEPRSTRLVGLTCWCMSFAQARRGLLFAALSSRHSRELPRAPEDCVVPEACVTYNSEKAPSGFQVRGGGARVQATFSGFCGLRNRSPPCATLFSWLRPTV